MVIYILRKSQGKVLSEYAFDQIYSKTYCGGNCSIARFSSKAVPAFLYFQGWIYFDYIKAD